MRKALKKVLSHNSNNSASSTRATNTSANGVSNSICYPFNGESTGVSSLLSLQVDLQVHFKPYGEKMFQKVCLPPRTSIHLTEHVCSQPKNPPAFNYMASTLTTSRTIAPSTTRLQRRSPRCFPKSMHGSPITKRPATEEWLGTLGT